MTGDNLRNLALILLMAMALAGALGVLLLALAVRRLRSLEIPPDATFGETLYLTPLSLVVAIDMLDLALDILAAPISWAILDRLGLKALRGVAAVEALIPGTQIIPTLTFCWIAVRLMGGRFKRSSQGLIAQ